MAANQARRDDNLLEDIQSRLDVLNKSERKVAEAILRDPSAATRYSIAALARAADVSEPTVNRFCRGFSATGFPDFKIRLAQSIATGTPYIGQNIEPDDTVAEFADKIMLSTIASLDKARQALDPKALATAIDYLIQAKQINFFGMGGSASVALDAQHKFFRFNIPVMSYDDALMQRMVAAGSSVGDVIVLISYTGGNLHGGIGRYRARRHRGLHADVVTHYSPDRHRHSGNRCNPQARRGFPRPSQENQGKPQAHPVPAKRNLTTATERIAKRLIEQLIFLRLTRPSKSAA